MNKQTIKNKNVTKKKRKKKANKRTNEKINQVDLVFGIDGLDALKRCIKSTFETGLLL